MIVVNTPQDNHSPAMRQEAIMRVDLDLSANHQDLANKFLEPYRGGWMDAKELWAKIAHLKAVMELVEQQCKDEVVDYLARNYGKEAVTESGVRMKFRSGGGRWTYPDNPAIDDASKRLKHLQKLAQECAKAKVDGVADGSTGEMINRAVYVENKDTLEVEFV